MWYLREASNGKFSVVCEMWKMDPWKMRKSKEGDLEVGERFCVKDARMMLMDLWNRWRSCVKRWKRCEVSVIWGLG